MLKKISVVGPLFAALFLLSACQNPNGSTDYGRSALLGAGVGAAAGVFGGVLNDVGNSQARPHGRRFR